MPRLFHCQSWHASQRKREMASVPSNVVDLFFPTSQTFPATTATSAILGDGLSAFERHRFIFPGPSELFGGSGDGLSAFERRCFENVVANKARHRLGNIAANKALLSKISRDNEEEKTRGNENIANLALTAKEITKDGVIVDSRCSKN